jgi:polyferredoxin
MNSVDTILMPRFKLIELPVIPVYGTSGDITPLIVLMLIFLYALISLLNCRKINFYRNISMILSSFFLVVMVHRTMCFLRGWIFGIQLIGKNSLIAFYYLSMFAALTFFGLVAGNIFCGWMCPVGWLQEISASVSYKLKVFFPEKITKWINFIFSIILVTIVSWSVYKTGPYSGTSLFVSENTSTFLVLIMLFFLPFLLIRPKFAEKLNSIRFLSFLFRMTVLILGIWVTNPGCTLFESEFENSSIITLAALIAASFIVPKLYCKMICPFGAWFSLINKKSLIKLNFKNIDQCISCNKCKAICPLNISIKDKNSLNECILCGKCLKKCDNRYISLDFDQDR